ncbi:MAG: TIM barrel protein [Defluviitaleaceae bacterium]|nr:TIM barrel protein [Defluviitaleaceae bacterium]
MKFSVCVEAVYNGRDFVSSMREIKSLGYDAFEFWGWWDKDIDRINAARQELDMRAAAFCTRFISLTEPSARQAYIEGLKESVQAAKKLGCDTLISQVGADLPGVPRHEQHKSVVDGLKACAPLLEAEGVTLVIEPLNLSVDHAGYYLWQSDEAAEIVGETASPRVKMLFDIYHQQISEGDVTRRIRKNLDLIGHMHAANTPGRHELDAGELNYRYIFEEIDAAGYDGYMGLEYFPVREPKNGLTEVLK